MGKNDGRQTYCAPPQHQQQAARAWCMWFMGPCRQQWTAGTRRYICTADCCAVAVVVRITLTAVLCCTYLLRSIYIYDTQSQQAARQMRFCAGQMSRAIYQSNASIARASHELSTNQIPTFSRATRNQAAFQHVHSCTHDPALQPHRPHRDRCLRQLRGLLPHQLSAMGGY